ncbi:pentapeptide repeat-containing protein, partial [Brevundimonas naejangsanensis]
GPTYVGKNVWLPQLFMEAARAGLPAIENRRFENCLMEGPAVLLPLEGCNFDGCNMGDAKGDPRNLMLTPMGPQRVTGPIPFKNCQFINCNFLGVGFTGPSDFLDNMVAALSQSGTAQ